ncbi:MAG: hypothetical protein J5926_04125 [Ruminococcus sp.]|nr:hypothetical protein [Ruminococcus sp.]
MLYPTEYGKDMEIAFSGKNTRNDSVKLLSTYAGLADGQKYINLRQHRTKPA